MRIRGITENNYLDKLVHLVQAKIDSSSTDGGGILWTKLFITSILPIVTIQTLSIRIRPQNGKEKLGQQNTCTDVTTNTNRQIAITHNGGKMSYGFGMLHL